MSKISEEDIKKVKSECQRFAGAGEQIIEKRQLKHFSKIS